MKTKVSIKRLEQVGFIYKKLFKNWYLVRLHANPNKIGYNIIFPLKLIEEK